MFSDAGDGRLGGSPHRQALLIFNDDGSLAVARAFAEQLEGLGWRCDFMRFMRNAASRNDLSERQLKQGLAGRTIAIDAVGLQACDELLLERYDIVAAAKFPPSYVVLWLTSAWRFNSNRPCFVALFPGVELRGFRGPRFRRHADVLCLPTLRDLTNYEASSIDHPPWQTALRFHPKLIRSTQTMDRPRNGGTVVFFGQSKVPATLPGRLDVAQAIRGAAAANPDRPFIIKLRHRTGENVHHVEPEQYGYEWLIAESGGAPKNLSFDDGPAEHAIEHAGLVITCCSTAGFEALAHGVCTLFFLDYAEADRDPLNDPARRLLKESGLLASRDDVLSLSPRQPNREWADGVLSENADLHRLIASVEHCKAQMIQHKASKLRNWFGRVVAHIVQTLRPL
jgi:hypothetical protein